MAHKTRERKQKQWKDLCLFTENKTNLHFLRIFFLWKSYLTGWPLWDAVPANSTECISSWEAESSSANQWLSRLLRGFIAWKQEVVTGLYVAPASSISTLVLCYFGININNILQSTVNGISFRFFRIKKIVSMSHLSHAIYLFRPSHLAWFDHRNNILRRM